MKYFKILSVLFLAVILVGGLFLMNGCAKKEPETIKIGAILPLTGNLAVLGEPEKNGMTLAVEELNSKNSINEKKIEIIFEDSKGQPKEGVTTANKLIEINKVRVLLSSTTGISRSIAPIADLKHIPFITLCMDPTIQKDSKYVFRLYESMGQEAEVLLSYFKERKNVNRVGILYVHHQGAEQQLNDYFVPGFKKLGVEVAVAEPYEISAKDFKSQIVKIKGAKVDHLIIIGYGFENPTIFKELKQYDLIGKINILGGWGFTTVSNVPKELVEGVIVAAPTYVFKKNKQAKEFVRNYKAKFGIEPNFDAAFAYDDIMILAEAIKKAEDDSITIQQVLSLTTVHEGIMGKVYISSDGDLNVPMGLGIIKDGKILPLEMGK